MGPEIASPFPSDVFNEFGSLVQILISGREWRRRGRRRRKGAALISEDRHGLKKERERKKNRHIYRDV